MATEMEPEVTMGAVKAASKVVPPDERADQQG